MKPISRKETYASLALIFVIAFVLNLVWEHLHFVLYVHYQGGEITNGVLFRAALFDASFITLIAIPFLLVPFFAMRRSLVILAGIVFAVLLERFALSTGRWEYQDVMPLIPLLGTGLTPTVQLGLLGYLSLEYSRKFYFTQGVQLRDGAIGSAHTTQNP